MQRKTTRNMALTFGPAFLLIGSLLLPSPAQAGFKWVAPPVQEAPSPALDTLPDVQVITGQRQNEVSGDVSIIMAPNTMVARAPAVPAYVPPVAPAPTSDVVQGFATNVPLSVALRQILPHQVGFSVAQDVSLGTIVSWNGGQSWRTVLTDMLAPEKLTIREANGLVHVVHMTTVQATSTLPATAPVALAPAPALAPVALAPATHAPTRTARQVYTHMPDRPAYTQPETTVKTLGYLPSVTAAVPAQNHMNQTWVAHKGQMLREVLMDWGRRANIDVSWQAEYDYPFQASVSVMGTFENATRSLLAGFQDADPKPVGYLYNNQTAGQRVLVIQTRGNKYSD